MLNKALSSIGKSIIVDKDPPVSRPLAVAEARSKSSILDLAPGIVTLLTAVPVALLIHLVHEFFQGQTEKAILILGGIFAAILAFPAVIYVLILRKRADPGTVGLIAIGTLGVLLASIYMYRASFNVFFPADILSWSESDFVNDILKFRVGYPLYSAEVNNDSYFYAPGAQLLTYLLAWLTGSATSIPLYRVIQVFYTLLAALIAVDCCRRLVELSFPARRSCRWRLWSVIWVPIFFLISTNYLTNPYIHNLHNDSLSLLVTTLAFWLLLRYVSEGKKGTLALMAVIPAVGFSVKQSLAVWALLYCLHLAVFDPRRSIRRLAPFALASFGGVGVVVAGAYHLWGSYFVYWTVDALAKHDISPLRSFEHVLDVWPYLAIGLLGGFVLLRGKSFNLLIGPWIIWLFLILFQAYTSGAASMLNHIGPGSLIAGIWFLAALTRIWPQNLIVANLRLRSQNWLRVSLCAAVVVMILVGLGLVRIPVRPLPKDAFRYVHQIQKQFEGHSAQSVLLDVGTWVYVRDGVVMKDRAAAIGEQGYSGIGDFSGIIERLEQKHYSKILVRNLNSPGFWYDQSSWPKPSGIRKAMLENYHEVGKIEAVDADIPRWVMPYTLGEISILVPN